MGAVPEQAAPTLGEVLATKLIPNWAVPAEEVHPVAQAAIVFAPEVSVVPETVTDIPAVPFVANVIVCEPVTAAPVDKVPSASEFALKLKLKV